MQSKDIWTFFRGKIFPRPLRPAYNLISSYLGVLTSLLGCLLGILIEKWTLGLSIQRSSSFLCFSTFLQKLWGHPSSDQTWVLFIFIYFPPNPLSQSHQYILLSFSSKHIKISFLLLPLWLIQALSPLALTNASSFWLRHN